MGVVLDSSWVIALERARITSDPLGLHLPVDSAISTVTLAELRVGLEFADTRRRPQREAFLNSLCELVALLDFDSEAAAAYARIAVSLRRSGSTIGDRDLMIAATAVANGLPLITLNRKEFERVPGLELIDSPITGP